MSLLNRFDELAGDGMAWTYASIKCRLLNELLLYASMSSLGTASRISELLANGASPTVQQSAALRNSAELSSVATRILLTTGADIHANDDEAFWRAYHANDLQVMKILLNAGANLWSQSSSEVARRCVYSHKPEALAFVTTYWDAHDLLRSLGISECLYRYFYQSKDFLHFIAYLNSGRAHTEKLAERRIVFSVAQDELPKEHDQSLGRLLHADQLLLDEIWKTGRVDVVVPNDYLQEKTTFRAYEERRLFPSSDVNVTKTSSNIVDAHNSATNTYHEEVKQVDLNEFVDTRLQEEAHTAPRSDAFHQPTTDVVTKAEDSSKQPSDAVINVLNNIMALENTAGSSQVPDQSGFLKRRHEDCESTSNVVELQTERKKDDASFRYLQQLASSVPKEPN